MPTATADWLDRMAKVALGHDTGTALAVGEGVEEGVAFVVDEKCT